MHSDQGQLPVTPPGPSWIAQLPRLVASHTAALWREPVNPGENFFTPDEWQRLGLAFDFSERELAVTVLLVEGWSRDEIGARLQKSDGSKVSIDTVRVYIDRIFLKVQAYDRMGLVLRLVRAHRDLIG